jgi:hypothetical protein
MNTKTYILISRRFPMTILCLALLILPACSIDVHQVTDNAIIAAEQNLPQIVTGLTRLGLTQWAKKDPAAAKEGAKIIAQNVRTVALPYFSSGTLPLTVAAQNAIKTIGGDKLPTGAAIVILGVVGAIQAVIAAPEPDGYMTEQQRVDVVAGLTALAAECERFSR